MEGEVCCADPGGKPAGVPRCRFPPWSGGSSAEQLRVGRGGTRNSWPAQVAPGGQTRLLLCPDPPAEQVSPSPERQPWGLQVGSSLSHPPDCCYLISFLIESLISLWSFAVCGWIWSGKWERWVLTSVVLLIAVLVSISHHKKKILFFFFLGLDVTTDPSEKAQHHSLHHWQRASAWLLQWQRPRLTQSWRWDPPTVTNHWPGRLLPREGPEPRSAPIFLSVTWPEFSVDIQNYII